MRLQEGGLSQRKGHRLLLSCVSPFVLSAYSFASAQLLSVKIKPGRILDSTVSRSESCVKAIAIVQRVP